MIRNGLKVSARFRRAGLRFVTVFQVTRSAVSGDRAYIDSAVDAVQRVITLMPPGHSGLAMPYVLLGDVLRYRFLQTGDVADLDAAVNAAERGVAIARPDDPRLWLFFTSLGVALVTRYDFTADDGDLEEAVTLSRRSVDIAPRGPQSWISYSNLSNALRTRFEKDGHLADINRAVSSAEQAARLAGRTRRRLLASYTNLGTALSVRYQFAGEISDLDEAIRAGEKAIGLARRTDLDFAMSCSNLSDRLLLRAELTGDDVDLGRAISAARAAVGATSAGNMNLPMYCANLGNALLKIYENSGELAALEEAISAGREAVGLTLDASPRLPMFCSNLGNLLMMRFRRTGDGAAIDEAIDFVREAIKHTPVGHPDLGMYYSNLGNVLRVRYGQSGDNADAEEAVRAGQAMIANTPGGHPKLGFYYSNLSSSWQARFRRTHDHADIAAAIDTAERAVGLSPARNPNLAGCYTNLSNAMLARFEHGGEGSDLDAAIRAARKALDLTRPGHPSIARCYSNLSYALRERHAHSGAASDLDDAITMAERAIELTAQDHPSIASYSYNLSQALLAKCELDKDSRTFDRAVSCLRAASDLAVAPAASRLAAAWLWGQAAGTAQRYDLSADGYAAAVGLLPLTAWHGLNRATREEHLETWSGLASDAAECSILAGQPRRAIELLEQGRSVLWTQALAVRGDLSGLARHCPELAARLDEIRSVLDPRSHDPYPVDEPEQSGAVDSPVHSGDLQRRMAREWDDILIQVRALNGFDRFLMPTLYQALAAAAEGGPVVILNCGARNCHALIIGPQSPGPRVVALPDLTLEAADRHVAQIDRALAGIQDHAEGTGQLARHRDAILDTLDWLWRVITKPVLAELDYLGTSGSIGPRARIWWCPTGPLSSLPIHASGQHGTKCSGPEPQCALRLAVSSYTPTLAALVRARQITGQDQRERTGHLTVAMPETPGLDSLPGASAEIRTLERYFPPGSGNVQLIGPEATRQTVTAALATATWAHLTCHARQHPDPDRSGFALHRDELTLTDIVSLPSMPRELAFLAACQTASGSQNHADEALHLAAAMQYIGFRHVIATMWNVLDSTTRTITNPIYKTLTHDHADASRSAHALHQAVLALHDDLPASPDIWAPFLHYGT